MARGVWLAMNVEDEIRDIVSEINEAWLERRTQGLARFLHDEIVIAPPGFQGWQVVWRTIIPDDSGESPSG